MTPALEALLIVFLVLVFLAGGLATLKYTARLGLPKKLPPPLPDMDSHDESDD
jgi:hypothetical protein